MPPPGSLVSYLARFKEELPSFLSLDLPGSSQQSSYLASAEQRSSNSALLTDSGLPEDSSGALQSEAPAQRLRFKQPVQARPAAAQG